MIHKDFEKGILSIRPDAKIYVFEIDRNNAVPLHLRLPQIEYYEIGLGYGHTEGAEAPQSMHLSGGQSEQSERNSPIVQNKPIIRRERIHNNNVHSRSFGRQSMFKGSGVYRKSKSFRRALYTAPLKSLKRIMKSLGHNYIDVLKMDIT